MHGKKALIISTSGGSYEGAYAAMEHSQSLAKSIFQFMGYAEIEMAVGANMNRSATDVPKILTRENEKLTRVAKQWYG
jgi:FMN-dependent NADH-azoreductase